MSKTKAVAVRVLSKEFQVVCPEGAELELREAASLLDGKMREIRNSGRVIGLERIAIMAALNISHEMLCHRQQKEDYIHSLSLQIQRLQTKIDEALMSSLVASEATVATT